MNDGLGVCLQTCSIFCKVNFNFRTKLSFRFGGLITLFQVVLSRFPQAKGSTEHKGRAGSSDIGDTILMLGEGRTIAELVHHSRTVGKVTRNDLQGPLLKHLQVLGLDLHNHRLHSVNIAINTRTTYLRVTGMSECR